MIRICAGCRMELGEKPPLDDKRVTHGMCPACVEETKTTGSKLVAAVFPDGPRYSFTVRGKVPPKGSARSFAVRRGGAFTGQTVTVQGNAATLADWKARVGWAARAAGVPLAAGPVALVAVFRVARPKSHYRASGALKPGAPVHVPKKPDGDKLERALWDALTGAAWLDDCQVVRWAGEKTYAAPGWDGVHICLAELP